MRWNSPKQRESAKKLCIERNTKHNLTHTPLYRIWKHMRQRCLNKNNGDYSYYGGRGITVCSEWSDPVVFITWAQLNGYQSGLTLDRVDNNGNYEPGNCRWVSRKIQDSNRRITKYVEHEGNLYTLVEFIEKFSPVSDSTFRARLRLGYTPQEAISLPLWSKR